MQMTEIQKSKIKNMRCNGIGYRAIATELDLSYSAVKSYCRRNNLTGYGNVVAMNIEVSVQKGLICKNCGKKLKHTAGKRKRIFCSDNCRKVYWKQKKEVEKLIEHIEPKATADGVAVYCAHDKIVDTDELVGNPRNPNKHPKDQITALAKIIKRQGWRHPIVVSNRSGFVVKGHGRLLAAKELEVKQVPVDYQDYESEASEYADLMADNKIQEFSELDLKMSADILQDIKDSGDIELEMSAFTEEALNELLAQNQEDEAQEDNFDVDAELEKPCFSKTGDIWCLGKHRVICGDSTLSETYNNLLGDEKVNLVCTDPPYFVALQSSSGTIKNDDLNDKDGYEFLMKAFNCLHESMAKDASIYVFYATAKGRIFHDAFEDAGFKVGAGLVWKKDRLVLTRTDWKYIHEPILWGWRKDGKHKWYGDQKQKTVFEFDRIKNSKEDGCGHPSSKPVPLIGYLIEQCTASNGLVLDCFLGSASTLIACEQLNRICYGIELEPKFVDVAVKRYIAATDNSDDVYVIRDGEKIPYCEVNGITNIEED